MVNVSIGFSVIFYFNLLGEPAFCFKCQSSQCCRFGEVIQGPQPSRGREYFKEEKGISSNSLQLCLYPGLRQKSGRFPLQVCPSQSCNTGICISSVKVLLQLCGAWLPAALGHSSVLAGNKWGQRSQCCFMSPSNEYQLGKKHNKTPILLTREQVRERENHRINSGRIKAKIWLIKSHLWLHPFRWQNPLEANV